MKLIIEDNVLKKVELEGEIEVVIPDGVTEIGSIAFYGCASLASVTIPSSVTRIGDRLFYKCAALESVDIPDSVTEIGLGAFWGCASLASLTLPGGVKKIDASAFDGCDALIKCEGETIRLLTPSLKLRSLAAYLCNPAAYDEWAIAAHNKLCKSQGKKLVAHICESGDLAAMKGYVDLFGVAKKDFPAMIEAAEAAKAMQIAEFLDEYRDSEANAQKTQAVKAKKAAASSANKEHEKAGFKIASGKLTKYSGGDKDVVIPDSVTGISSTAFKDATSVVSIAIGGGVLDIAETAFDGCAALEEIIVSESNPKYASADGALLTKNMDALIRVPMAKQADEYVIPETVASYSKSAFLGCSGIGFAVVPRNVFWLKNNHWQGARGIRFTSVIEHVGKGMEFYTFDAVAAAVTPEAFTYIPANAKHKFMAGFLLKQGCFDVDYRSSQIKYCKSQAKKMLPQVFTTDNVALAQGFMDIVEGSAEYYNIALGAAKKANATQIAAFLLDYRNRNITDADMDKAESKTLSKSIDSAAKKRTKSNEVLANLEELTIDGLERITEDGHTYVKVKFADGRAYKYECGFKVQVGDRVIVSGSRNGEVGAVVEVGADIDWLGPAHDHMQVVEEAYRAGCGPQIRNSECGIRN